MNTFKIDGTDFGVGEFVCDIANGVIKDLTITGDKEVTKSIANDENGKWSWISYNPPKVFFREIPFQQEIEITEELLDEYDISFYFCEHHDLYGILTVSDSRIFITGEIHQPMNDEKIYSIEIEVTRY